MRNRLLFWLPFALLICLLSCKKKNCPDDIPDWLCDKINQEVEEGLCSQDSNNCLIIKEYMYPGNELTYIFVRPGDGYSGIYYDYHGNIMCTLMKFDSCQFQCNGYTFCELEFVKNVWTEPVY